MRNIDGTMGHNIKPENTQDMEHSVLFSIQQTITQHNPYKKMQWLYIFGPRLYYLLPKYLRHIESVKTEKFKFELDKFLELIFWSAKTAQLCHCIRKQQHPRPAHFYEGSKNLPKWWSPRLGHGAVLAASKPLQVSKHSKVLYALSTPWYFNMVESIFFSI